MTHNVFCYEPTHCFICVFIYFSSIISFHVPEHHHTNDLQDVSLFSLPRFCVSSDLAVPFSPLYFCDFLILKKSRQTFLLYPLNVSIGIFTSFKFLKCEFSPIHAQSFVIQTFHHHLVFIYHFLKYFHTWKTCFT